MLAKDVCQVNMPPMKSIIEIITGKFVACRGSEATEADWMLKGKGSVA